MRKVSLVLFVCTLAAACSDKDPAGSQTEGAVGTYNLVTINNHPMPFPLIVVPAFGINIEYTSSLLVLTDVGGYQARDIVTDKSVSNAIRVDTVFSVGRWTQRDTLITMVDVAGGDTLKAGLRSGKLTYRVTLATDAGDSTYVFVYRKQ